MDALHACGYLSRVIELPVAVAEALFDDATQSLGSPDHTDPAAIGTALLPARRVRTRLGSPLPGTGVLVEIELSPWSKSQTEVAVRYGGNRQPHAVARYVYKRRAPDLLDAVTGAINARLPGAAAGRRAA
jgi:hypothetical protein